MCMRAGSRRLRVGGRAWTRGDKDRTYTPCRVKIRTRLYDKERIYLLVAKVIAHILLRDASERVQAAEGRLVPVRRQPKAVDLVVLLLPLLARRRAAAAHAAAGTPADVRVAHGAAVGGAAAPACNRDERMSKGLHGRRRTAGAGGGDGEDREMRGGRRRDDDPWGGGGGGAPVARASEGTGDRGEMRRGGAGRASCPSI